MTARQRKLLILGVALIAFGAIKASLIFWYLNHKPAAQAAQRLTCDPSRGSCALPGGGGLRFDSAPEHGKPFVVRLQGTAAAAPPTADFTMPDMDMGFNRYTFVRDGTDWKATVTLPMCVSGSRAWLVEVRHGKDAYQLPFQVVH
ncbi:hypothetical protein C2134_14250 [Chromobacterium sinusclupearum]|uniref:Uncharacterized protein n=1 Tax=Chromobacterium sinusclupearum TaxID=2077146 RepID=A0A2K4ML86_9NEIS|nr:hypothetical protein [Chromobacterium sinusclupearum]POA97818.1 hypothetical protein C2134_14250 [Chromobacterium sinusclupearum]